MEKINILNDFLFYLVLLNIFIKGLIRSSKRFLCFFFGSMACLWFLNIKEEKGFRQYNTTQIFLENQTALQASFKSVRKNLSCYMFCYVYYVLYMLILILFHLLDKNENIINDLIWLGGSKVPKFSNYMLLLDFRGYATQQLINSTHYLERKI